MNGIVIIIGNYLVERELLDSLIAVVAVEKDLDQLIYGGSEGNQERFVLRLENKHQLVL